MYRELNKITLKAPVKMGDLVVENILNTGVDVIATKTWTGRALFTTPQSQLRKKLLRVSSFLNCEP